MKKSSLLLFYMDLYILFLILIHDFLKSGRLIHIFLIKSQYLVDQPLLFGFTTQLIFIQCNILYSIPSEYNMYIIFYPNYIIFILLLNSTFPISSILFHSILFSSILTKHILFLLVIFYILSYLLYFVCSILFFYFIVNKIYSFIFL